MRGIFWRAVNEFYGYPNAFVVSIIGCTAAKGELPEYFGQRPFSSENGILK